MIKPKRKLLEEKNGFGFKLVLIWSTWGKIETIDHTRKLKYVQNFTINLIILISPQFPKLVK